MQNTINAFLDGITTDLHPLTIPETALTSALNATLITFNGNEQILQNDMGNTLIKDSITGSIMLLSNGFVPIGMKEHGGILYIASYNPDTQEGELGSIPSPILHYTYNQYEENRTNSIKLTTDIVDGLKIEDGIIENTITILSDLIFHPGDKYVVVLNLDLDESTDSTPGGRKKLIKTRSDEIGTRSDGKTSYKILSSYELIDDQIKLKKGWYKLKLYAITESSKEPIEIKLNRPQAYYTNGHVEQYYSDQWFLYSNQLEDLDMLRMRTQNAFNTYPNISPGRLAIKLVPEEYPELDYLYNESYAENYPMIYYGSVSEDEDPAYWLIFHGFLYVLDGPVIPDKLEISCENLKILYWDGSKFAEDNTFVVTNKKLVYRESYKYGDNPERVFPYDYQINYVGDKCFLDDTEIDEENHIHYITKREFSDEYHIENYEDQYTLGLFYIKLKNLNTSIRLHVKCYTLTYEYNNLSKSFVLYKTQDFPEFNPALHNFDESGVIQGEFVNQYLDITKTNGETFDLPLFNANNNGDQYCFLYLRGGNLKFLDNDDPTEGNIEYILKYKKNDEDLYGEYYAIGRKHTLDAYQDLRTWIYPQYTVSVDNDGQESSWFDFLWQQIKKITSDTSKWINVGNCFVVSSVLPEVYGYIDGQISSSTKRVGLLALKDNPSDNKLEFIKNIAKSQRDYFSQYKNLAGLTASNMEDCCLFKTNLRTINQNLSHIWENYWDKGDPGSLLNGNFKPDLPSTGVELFWDYTSYKLDSALDLWCMEKNAKYYIDQTLSDSQGLEWNQTARIFRYRDNDSYGATDDMRDYWDFFEQGGDTSSISPTYYSDGINTKCFTEYLCSHAPGCWSVSTPLTVTKLSMFFYSFSYSFQYLYVDNPEIVIVNKVGQEEINKDLINGGKFPDRAGLIFKNFRKPFLPIAFNVDIITNDNTINHLGVDMDDIPMHQRDTAESIISLNTDIIHSLYGGYNYADNTF